MYEYITKIDGKFMHVHDLEECLESIRIINKKNQETINRLGEQNRKLNEEYYKDELVQQMQQRLDQMSADYYRGFPISEKEKAAIDAWKLAHEKEVHGGDSYAGAIGGRYSYHFVPTSIGTSGVIRCSCGAEFEFQEIG